MASAATATPQAGSSAHQHPAGSLRPETSLVLVIILYLICMFTGRQQLKRIAKSWCRAHAGPQGVLSRNFAVLGSLEAETPEPDLCWQPAPATFKFWCSGRRNCNGALITLDMRKRHNLFSRMIELVNRGRDFVHIDIFVPEGSLPSSVFAVTTPRAIKQLLKEDPTIGALAATIPVNKERLPHFPADILSVAAEHASVFTEVFSDTAAAQLFARNGSVQLAAKYLRSIVYNPDAAAAVSLSGDKQTPKPALSFTFILPDEQHMDELQPLVALVFVVLDVLASYKLPAAVKQRAQEARTKLAQKAMKEVMEGRKEALQQKKQEKLLAERARAARAGPEALAKFEEQKARHMQKKAMRQRVKMIS